MRLVGLDALDHGGQIGLPLRRSMVLTGAPGASWMMVRDAVGAEPS